MNVSRLIEPNNGILNGRGGNAGKCAGFKHHDKISREVHYSSELQVRDVAFENLCKA
jgi:hypothetical protein